MGIPPDSGVVSVSWKVRSVVQGWGGVCVCPWKLRHDYQPRESLPVHGTLRYGLDVQWFGPLLVGSVGGGWGQWYMEGDTYHVCVRGLGESDSLPVAGRVAVCVGSDCRVGGCRLGPFVRPVCPPVEPRIGTCWSSLRWEETSEEKGQTLSPPYLRC